MKKTKLKFAAAVAALAMTFALFTGCNPGEDATSTSTTGSTDSTSTTDSTSGSGDSTDSTSESGDSTDNNTTAASDEEVAAAAVEIIKKADYTVKVSNAYSQADVSATGSDTSVTEGDLLILGGSVSSGTTPIGQVYFQVGFNGSSSATQLGSYWGGANKTETSYTMFTVFRVPSGYTNIDYMQICLQESTASGVSALAQNTEISMKDFYLMRLPAKDLATLAPGIFKSSATLDPDSTANESKYGYQSNFNFTSAIEAKTGKIAFVQYTRPEIDADYKSHYFQFVDSTSDNWSVGSGWQATYPNKDAQTIVYTWTIDKDFSWSTTQIGIQQQKDTVPSDGLAITDLTIRMVPTF